MALSEDSAAIAAAALTAAVIEGGGGAQPGYSREAAIAHVMDVYRRSLNVIRNASEAPRPRRGLVQEAVIGRT